MTALPDIPRLYTALAECLAVLLFTPGLVARFSRRATVAITLVWAVVLSAFLGLTGNVPGPFWIPCMVAAIGLSYLYLWGTWSITLLEAGYHCARAFIVAEFAASIEWQFHCYLWPSRSPVHPLSLVLLGVVYGVVFGVLSGLQHKLPQPTEHLQISGSAALTAVMLALTAFAVSNLGFLPGSEINMSVFSIRTLVDFSGVLVLAVQHEQLRENALHNELAAMDKVLHRQYEQYKRSKEGVKLINRRYHELKLQLAIIRQEQDQAKQNAALEAIEENIRQYEAENKTGNPVLDTILTCQDHGVPAGEHQHHLRGRWPDAGFFDHPGAVHHRGGGPGQRHCRRPGPAGPGKAAGKGGGVRPGGLCDAAVRALHRDTAGAGPRRPAAPGPGPEKPPHRRPAAWGQHDPPLGEQLVHPADPVPPARKQMIGPRKHLRPSHPGPKARRRGCRCFYF